MRQSPPFMLERHIPLALLFTLFLQAGSAVWWASAKEAADHARDKRIAEIETRASQQDNRQIVIIERLARLEALAENQTVMLRQIATQTARK